MYLFLNLGLLQCIIIKFYKSQYIDFTHILLYVFLAYLLNIVLQIIHKDSCNNPYYPNAYPFTMLFSYLMKNKIYFQPPEAGLAL